MSAAILCIGTELTRGEIQNTNATWLANELSGLGLAVNTIEVVADDVDRIVSTLRRLCMDCDILVCTGGLGPTTDDITAASVAKLLGVPLVRDPASLDVITRLVESHGRTMTESNAKQADFPRGATVLPNPLGSAPGFAVSVEGARAYFMPGVPREMYRMFDDHVAPHASTLVDDPIVQRKLTAFRLPESGLNDMLAGTEERFGVTVGYRAHFPVVEVKLLASGASPLGSAANRTSRALEHVRRVLGDYVVAEGNTTLVEAAIDAVRARGWKLALAESCTGGLVAHLLTCYSVSDLFLGSAVTYANEAKERLVGVRPATLERHGAVSPEVSREMARGALDAFGADVALAITGVAGPAGGTRKKPVGLVYLSVATSDADTPLELRRVFDRHRIQSWAAHNGIELVRRVALGLSPLAR